MKKIALPNIPNMEVVQKNLWSIICGVVALIAVIALFYPLGGKKEKLQQDLETRATEYQSLQQLETKSRTLPIVDPSNTTPQPLTRYPNQELIDKAGAIPKAFAQQAATIAGLALKMNVHDPLVANSLPRPSSNVEAFDFRDAYQRMMAKDGGLVKMLNAGHPPTADEVTAAQQRLWQTQYVPELVYPQGQTGGQALNQQQVQAAFDADKLSVPVREIQRVADTSTIYLDATALTVSSAPSLMNSGAAAAASPEDIWYAQLGLWMQQDVIQAILRTNAGFKNVMEAPAKRLLKIAIDARPYLIPPTYAAGQLMDTDDKAPVPKDIHVSTTGRLCNSMYDVMHFDIIINVAADKIPWLLDELSNGEFITVLKCDVKTVDAGVDQTLGYMYGTQPVVQLHLVCEEVFLRDWDRKLMPKEVAGNLQGVSAVGGGSAYTQDMGMDQGGGPPAQGDRADSKKRRSRLGTHDMMTKIVDFLEQQVQWIAIGIGVLFLAFTIWAYVINNPIATPLNGANVTLGNVEQTILEGAGKPLQEKINSSVEIPSMGTPPEFSGPFSQQMDIGRAKYQAVTMGGHWIDAPTASNTAMAAPGEHGNGPVVSLPTPPAPDLVGVLASRALVTAPGNAGGGNANPGNVGNAPNPANAGPVDKNWVTVEGKISIAALGPQLTLAKFPADKQVTDFLRIQLDRQEQLPDGTWGNDTIVEPPSYLNIPPLPGPGKLAAGIQYQLWSKANVTTILQPAPYQVVKGTIWYLPSDTDTAQALLAAPPVPAPGASTPDNRAPRNDRLNNNERRQRPPQGGAPGAFAPQANTDAAVLAQATIPPNFNGGPGGPPPPGAPAPDNNPPAQPQAPQANPTAAVQKYAVGLPQGDFDPSKQADIECWGFDDSVEPGKNYRYRFRYLVFNPAYSSPLAGTPQVAHELALISPYSKWSTPATSVPALVDFFVASGISAGNKVNFKIYKWQNGETTTVNEQDAAGDIIGAQHANVKGVDYTTPWTMLAIHRDYDSSNYVLLVNPAGQIIRHDWRGDELDPLNKELRHEVAPPAPVVPNNGANPPRQPQYQQQRGIGAAGAG